MQSFSQHGQDLFVFENFFRHRPADGFFVDIGAYDGVTFSNSLFFERHLGWSGICIEPIPSVFEKMRASRSAVNVNCAVSDSDGIAEFIDADIPNFGKMYSGLRADYDPRHMQILQTHATATQVLQVPTRRLDQILNDNGVRKIDYLSIDTEGSELKILKSIDFSSYDINVISVENNYNDVRIRGFLRRCGYRFIHLFAGFDELYAK